MFRRFFIMIGLFATFGLLRSARADEAVQNHLVDVVYEHKEGVALTMDVFKPEKPNGIGVLWIVSGGWFSNHNDINPELAKYFNSRGITLFEVVHGSRPRFFLPEIIQDINRAVRFVRTHAADWNVDPNRLGISGGSAGGHLSLMIGAYGGPGDPNAKDPVDRASSEVEAVACFFPPTDFLNYGKEGENAMKLDKFKAYWHVLGVTDQTTEAERIKIGHDVSPIYGNLSKMPPTLIIHGDADTLVPLQQSERFMDALEKNKIPHKLIIHKGGGHNWPGIGKYSVQLVDWFEKYLGKK